MFNLKLKKEVSDLKSRVWDLEFEAKRYRQRVRELEVNVETSGSQLDKLAKALGYSYRGSHYTEGNWVPMKEVELPNEIC